MNKDQATGKFEQLKGKIKETWGRLSDDDIALYRGKQEQFYGKLQEKYGVAREEAEKRLSEFEAACTSGSCSSNSERAA
ncbi:MAG: CsbD family protein [Pseudomonadota bacterium]|nr:CsbD family protein [Pseudomonadota bacterium]